MRIGIVAGEVSGDILGAGLITSLMKYYPQCQFEGIGGERMMSLGFKSLYPLERLSVMGFVEPLKRLPELLSIRRSLRKHFTANPPDVFIGIDAPAFNLSLEGSLKRKGIQTVHYVSPSVWAWRQGRVKKIARAVDLMLTLFPFEASFYKNHRVNVVCVGHPLADDIPLEPDMEEARKKLALEPNPQVYVALLPGSRGSEIERITPIFLNVALRCLEKDASLKFIIPAANRKCELQIKDITKDHPALPLQLVSGQSHQVMAAANVVAMASGTTTLEALLLKKPMVIAYSMGRISYTVLRWLVKSKYIGLPNILAGRGLVPEYIQKGAIPEHISASLLEYLQNADAVLALKKEYREIHLSLKKNASEKAAAAINTLLLGSKGGAE